MACVAQCKEMANPVDHLDEEAAEKYTLGELSAKKLATIEEHLLICGKCREAVASSDAYVAAMKKAATAIREAEKDPKHRVLRANEAEGYSTR